MLRGVSLYTHQLVVSLLPRRQLVDNFDQRRAEEWQRRKDSQDLGEEKYRRLDLLLFPPLESSVPFQLPRVAARDPAHLVALIPRVKDIVAHWRHVEVVLQNDDGLVIYGKRQLGMRRQDLLVKGDKSCGG